MLLGLGTLASALILPFYIGKNATPPVTLYQAFSSVFQNLGNLQTQQIQSSAPVALVMAAGALVIASGLLGVFPLTSAILGVSGMLMLTILPFLADSGFSPGLFASGTGFWVIWLTSLCNFIPASILGRRRPEIIREREMLVMQPVVLSSDPQLGSSALSSLGGPGNQLSVLVNCDSCGSRNLAAAKFCMECGSELESPDSPPLTSSIAP